ncbi:hypothetical protein DFH09DRAFT_1299594 [Mycena vulgaris]|nr:hypothetical protein DFH09DRAFT_1299594 [Mycena vulgaris]
MTFMKNSSAIPSFSSAGLNLKKSRRDELGDDDDEAASSSASRNRYLLRRRAQLKSSRRLPPLPSPLTFVGKPCAWDLADTIRGLNIRKTRRAEFGDDEDENGRPQKRLKLSLQPKPHPARVPRSTIMHRRPRRPVAPVSVHTNAPTTSASTAIPAAPISADPMVAPCAIDAAAGPISRGLADMTNVGVNCSSKVKDSGAIKPIQTKPKHGKHADLMIMPGRKKWVGNKNSRRGIRPLNMPIQIPTFLLLVSGKYRLVDTPVWTLLKIRPHILYRRFLSPLDLALSPPLPPLPAIENACKDDQIDIDWAHNAPHIGMAGACPVGGDDDDSSSSAYLVHFYSISADSCLLQEIRRRSLLPLVSTTTVSTGFPALFMFFISICLSKTPVSIANCNNIPPQPTAHTIVSIAISIAIPLAPHVILKQNHSPGLSFIGRMLSLLVLVTFRFVYCRVSLLSALSFSFVVPALVFHRQLHQHCLARLRIASRLRLAFSVARQPAFSNLNALLEPRRAFASRRTSSSHRHRRSIEPSTAFTINPMGTRFDTATPHRYLSRLRS